MGEYFGVYTGIAGDAAKDSFEPCTYDPYDGLTDEEKKQKQWEEEWDSKNGRAGVVPG